MTDRVRILLVDDEALLREGLRALLELEEHFEVVGEAADGIAACELVASNPPDVVLMDVQMPRRDGVEATRLIRDRHPDVAVIILTTFDDDEYVFEGLRGGACGYLLKDVSARGLADAVRAAARGEGFLGPSIAAKVLAEYGRLVGRTPPTRGDAPPAHSLSERELEIAKHLGRGLSNREIASEIHLSEGTVKNHLTRIFAKLGVRDRAQAALRVRDLDIS